MISSKNSNQPLVTIITPVYNREDLVKETVESVLNQDYPNLEYIVLDDGSRDDSLKILKEYGDRIRLESHPNMGETRTVNKGLQLARGEIVAIINSDDPLLPGAVSAIVQFMVKNPKILVVYPDWAMIDESGNVTDEIATYDYDYLNMVRWHICFPGPGTFFRTSIATKLAGRDPEFRYTADYEFWLRAGLIGPFARLPKVLATFRVHSGSASVSQKGHKMAEEHIRLIDKLYSLPKLPKKLLEVKNEAYASAYYAAGVVSGEDGALRRKYFAKSLRLAPHKYVLEYPYRFLSMLPFQGTLRSIWWKLVRVKHVVRTRLRSQ